jgi:hypothetical protein
MSSPDTYADWDAAYVLGALSGVERAEYEDHLAGCARCRDAVAELAGLPGLLGQLTPAEALALESGPAGTASPAGPVDGYPGPPPASLMPVIPLPAPRRRWLAPVAAVAAALLIGGVGGYAVSESWSAGPGGATASSSTRLAFVPVQASPMTAVVDVLPTAAGTELRVECQYAQLTAGSGSAPSTGTGATGADRVYGDATLHYAIWVVGKDGSNAQVKDWTARTGRVMHPSGVTALPRAAIAAVEIRQVDTGDTVMRAQVG